MSKDVKKDEPKAPEPFKRVKITHYKVFTSQGRAIEGQFIELPASEAAKLVADKQAESA